MIKLWLFLLLGLNFYTSRYLCILMCTVISSILTIGWSPSSNIWQWYTFLQIYLIFANTKKNEQWTWMEQVLIEKCRRSYDILALPLTVQKSVTGIFPQNINFLSNPLYAGGIKFPAFTYRRQRNQFSRPGDWDFIIHRLHLYKGVNNPLHQRVPWIWH